jgi:hypothetical protein
LPFVDVGDGVVLRLPPPYDRCAVEAGA